MKLKHFILLGALVLLAGGTRAGAQSTNAPGPIDYTTYVHFVAERNIFDPNRYSHARGVRRVNRRAPAVPAFALVGVMEYPKGRFAFFDGNSPEYRKAIGVTETIAGYTITEITPSSVMLQSTNHAVIDFKIGSQMRLDGVNGWELASVPTDLSPAQTGDTETADKPAATESPVDNSSNEGNDVLKRLMQQREQELK